MQINIPAKTGINLCLWIPGQARNVIIHLFFEL
jgi:hypothetical protein